MMQIYELKMTCASLNVNREMNACVIFPYFNITMTFKVGTLWIVKNRLRTSYKYIEPRFILHG